MNPASVSKAVAMAAILAGSATAAMAHDHAVLRGRLVFADHAQAVVRVLDLDTGEVTHGFGVPKPNPGFATTGDGRYVAIVTGDDAGTVRFLDTGLTMESHGDHVDIDKRRVRLLDLAVTGERPAHVVSGNGWLSLFYDGPRPWDRKGDPKAVLIDLDTLGTDRPTIAVWKSPAAQHGIAVPLGGAQWLMSQPKDAYAKSDNPKVSARPDGFRILDRAGGWAVVASFDDTADPQRSCKEFHGHASLGDVHVFGCNQALDGDERGDGGVLIIRQDGAGRWQSRKLAYPDERRTSTIKARPGGRYMIANYGLRAPYDAFLRIDPGAPSLSGADVFQVPEAQATCQFEISPDGRRVVNLTSDGKLRISVSMTSRPPSARLRRSRRRALSTAPTAPPPRCPRSPSSAAAPSSATPPASASGSTT